MYSRLPKKRRKWHMGGVSFDIQALLQKIPEITGQYYSRWLLSQCFSPILICHCEKLSTVILTDYAIAEISDKNALKWRHLNWEEGRKATGSQGFVRVWSYQQIGGTRKQGEHFRKSQPSDPIRRTLSSQPLTNSQCQHASQHSHTLDFTKLLQIIYWQSRSNKNLQ